MTVGKRAIIDSAKQVRRTLIDDLFEYYSESQQEENGPEVVFGKDLLQFVNSSGYFDDKNLLIKLLNAKNFHFKMDERGYHMVKSQTAAEWKNGKFRSRAAFVKKTVNPGDQQAVISKALNIRPLVFESGAIH